MDVFTEASWSLAAAADHVHCFMFSSLAENVLKNESKTFVQP